jgi:isopentenyl-diphosphate delta-isomerase
VDQGEALEHAVHRKLAQEFGFDTAVEEAFTFTYRATDAESGLTEHEFDHVFVGNYAGEPKPNPAEVDGWKWADPPEIERDLREHPGRYTPWFPIAFTKLMERRQNGMSVS